MELRDEFGLTIAVAEADEALTLRRTEVPPEAALLRVLDPPEECREALTRAGFVCKPAWLTWLAPAAQRESGMSTKARQDVRRARRRADEAGLRLVVQQPIQAADLDPFLAMYEQRIGEMPFGLPFAGRYRDDMLASERDFAVFAFEGEQLVGGCLCQESPEEDAVRLRFSAVEPRWRAASLARVCYQEAFRFAQERGYRWVTLGNDPNLYGHVPQPGLFFFKARLGFDPVPAALLTPTFAGDQADLLLRLERLTDPVLMLEYADTSGERARDTPVAELPALTARVFSSRPDTDVSPYRTRTVRRATLVRMPDPSATGRPVAG